MTCIIFSFLYLLIISDVQINSHYFLNHLILTLINPPIMPPKIKNKNKFISLK